MVERLVRHCFFGKLRVGFIGIGNKGHAAGCEDTGSFDFAPFLHVARDDFFDVVGGVDASDVEGSVLSLEGSYSTHVVSIVGMLVTPEAVDVAWEDVGDSGQTMEVLAVHTIGADTTRKEEAEVGSRRLVGFCISAVLCDVAASLGGCLGEVLVLSVTARPLIVPNVVDVTRLRNLLGLYRRRVDLWTRRSSFATDDLLNLFALGIGCDDCLFCRRNKLGRRGGFERRICRERSLCVFLYFCHGCDVGVVVRDVATELSTCDNLALACGSP